VIGNVLNATGHGWLWLAPIFMLSAVLTAFVVGFGGATPVRSFRWRFAILAAIQIATFTVLEIAERTLTGGDLGTLMADGGDLILAVGALVQTGVALLVSLGSRVVERIAAAFAKPRTTRPRRRPAPFARPSFLVLPPAGALTRASTPRAPPVFA
jgi:hypothetical protein